MNNKCSPLSEKKNKNKSKQNSLLCNIARSRNINDIIYHMPSSSNKSKFGLCALAVDRCLWCLKWLTSLVLTLFHQLCQNLKTLKVELAFFNAKYYLIRPHCLLFCLFSVVDYDLSKLLEKMNMLGWIGLPTPIFFDHALDNYIYQNKCIQFQL